MRFGRRIRPVRAVLAVLAAPAMLGACDLVGDSPAPGAATPATQASPSATVNVSQQESSNWAGYVVARSGDGVDGTSFSSVSASWNQPSVDCSVASPSYSAFWVGIGGYSGQHLEQIGTSGDCTARRRAVYYAWYELVPAPQVIVPLEVEPGDTVHATVTVDAQTVTVSMTDETSNETFNKRLHMERPNVASAEWIAEAPSECKSSNDCHVLPLADFDSVTFTDVSASAGGRRGTLDSGLGSVGAITLDGNAGFGRMSTTTLEAHATVGSLTSNGSSFTVEWRS